MGASQTIITSSLTVRFLASMFALLSTNNSITFLSFAFFAANKTAVLNSCINPFVYGLYYHSERLPQHRTTSNIVTRDCDNNRVQFQNQTITTTCV